jgi:hypothetical protein
LSSFLLKAMEKVVYRNIMDGALKIHPLHWNKHAYHALNNAFIYQHNLPVHWGSCPIGSQAPENQQHKILWAAVGTRRVHTAWPTS